MFYEYFTALQILIQPQSAALICGHNLRLSCHAVGKAPVQYQWFKSREEVSYNTSTQRALSNLNVKRVSKGTGFITWYLSCLV